MNICPYCQESNLEGAASCGKCRRVMYTQPQTEWASHISAIVKGYNTHGKKVVHGIQKDAIQNGWGARYGKSKWQFVFDLTTGPDGRTYLSMADQGTSGLIGTVYEDPNDIPETLPPSECLARFENMNFSGGNRGPGLYGRGKLIFQAGSKKGEIIYDSLTIRGEYRLGRRFQQGRRLNQFPHAVQGEKAKDMLSALTGSALSPLSLPGTRITIVDPAQELVNAVRSGELLQFIQETWWEVLSREKNSILVRHGGGEGQATCPGPYADLMVDKFQKGELYKADHQSLAIKGDKYQVKHLRMGRTAKPVPEGMRGICVQRKGMRICNVPLEDVPPELEDRLIGYVQLDEKYEQLIEEAEDPEHYNLSQQYSSARELFKFVGDHFERFKRQLGFTDGRQQREEDEVQQAVQEAQDMLNRIMSDLGIDGVGPKPKKAPIIVDLVCAQFPGSTNRVELGDSIREVTFQVANRSPQSRKVKIQIVTMDKSGCLIERLLDRNLTLNASEQVKLGPVDIAIISPYYPNYEMVTCACHVDSRGGERLAEARMPILVGIDPLEPTPPAPVEIALVSMTKPGQGSNRIDYGQSLEDIEYKVVNNTAHELQVRVPIRLHEGRGRSLGAVVLVAKQQDVKLLPLSVARISVRQLKFDQEALGSLDHSPATLRAEVISRVDQLKMEKGDRIARHDTVFWVNRDPPGLGPFEEIEWWRGGPLEPRSEVKPGQDTDKYILRLNSTHPAYEAAKAIKDSHTGNYVLKTYVFELMAREALRLALKKEDFRHFGVGLLGEPKMTLESQPYVAAELYNRALDKIMAKYNE